MVAQGTNHVHKLKFIEADRSLYSDQIAPKIISCVSNSVTYHYQSLVQYSGGILLPNIGPFQALHLSLFLFLIYSFCHSLLIFPLIFFFPNIILCW